MQIDEDMEEEIIKTMDTHWSSDEIVHGMALVCDIVFGEAECKLILSEARGRYNKRMESYGYKKETD